MSCLKVDSGKCYIWNPCRLFIHSFHDELMGAYSELGVTGAEKILFLPPSMIFYDLLVGLIIKLIETVNGRKCIKFITDVLAWDVLRYEISQAGRGRVKGSFLDFCFLITILKSIIPKGTFLGGQNSGLLQWYYEQVGDRGTKPLLPNLQLDGVSRHLVILMSYKLR